MRRYNNLRLRVPNKRWENKHDRKSFLRLKALFDLFILFPCLSLYNLLLKFVLKTSNLALQEH